MGEVLSRTEVKLCGSCGNLVYIRVEEVDRACPACRSNDLQNTILFPKRYSSQISLVYTDLDMIKLRENVRNTEQAIRRWRMG